MSPVIQYVPDFTFKFVDRARYQILNLLGAGSYGAVYRARERLPESGKFVPRAIKVVPRSRHGKALQIREITMHTELPRHHNIVTLHRAFEDGAYMFIVMDLLDGGDLHSHITRKHTLCRNDDLIKNVFLQIVDGVEVSHKAGIFHRDLKPDNILVNADLTRVCIADFGLATTSTKSKSFNTGTRTFMCPECVDCDDRLYPYSPRRSDIWALGVILVNIVTGHRPWDKATLEDDQFKSFLEEPDWLRSVFPISEGLSVILRRIFTIVPDEALTLAEIRREIRNLDTFYMSRADLKLASTDVRYMWTWYFPRVASALSEASSTDSEGGMDSWTESESSESGSDDSDDSDDSDAGNVPATQLLMVAEEGRLVLPRSLGAEQPASLRVVRPSPPRSKSSDEFPIRRPATRRAMLAPPSSSDEPSTASSSDAPITPETHALDVLVAEPNGIEPLVLERPLLCHGKDSIRIREKRGSVGAAVRGFARSLVSGRSA
ncbi:Negative regulator of sexual conjugation and meiosis [Trametes pubescens]|uniref:non-specific serine/threonine protein kinase n=1 Tax=Trametes pubescens TaxID=154538 RepID=A0A1M2V2C9_TRAPU|nr:Negative regulator of sexual conjugation and meiosis [Trametes pubescens]